jgi:membrane-bound lytic murein transglycosylase
VVPPLDRRTLHDQVAGEVSLTATRLAEHRCVAVDRQHVKWVAVVVLEVADWNKDGQRRRVRRSITSGDRCSHRPWRSHR